MTSQKLSRTTYRDPNLTSNPVRSGDSTRGENAIDMDNYYRPLEQVHGSSLHGWGVASGLKVTATLNSPHVNVQPGVALDEAGRHISLALGGQAEVDPNADNPGTTKLDLVDVTAADGATIPTTTDAWTVSGDKYVTIQWWETFDTDAYNDYGIYRYHHTPWLRLLSATDLDEGTKIVLAKVTLDTNGNVTGLTHEMREGVKLPTESIQFQKGHTAAGSPNFEIDNTDAGKISPLASGGIEISVPEPTDEIHFIAGQLKVKDGTNQPVLSFNGSSSYLSIGNSGNPGDLEVKDGAGEPALLLDGANASMTIGTDNNAGDLTFEDEEERETIKLKGDAATLRLGATGNAGDLLVWDDAGAESVMIEGASGNIRLHGQLRDGSNRNIGLNYTQKQDLTDGGISALHKHDIGNLGWNGVSGTQIGVIHGWIIIQSGYIADGVKGSVTLRFGDGSQTGTTGTGYSSHKMHGYRGNFRDVPNVILSPVDLNLSTHDDTWFDFWYNIGSNSITINWSIDTYGGSHEVDFLIIGPK